MITSASESDISSESVSQPQQSKKNIKNSKPILDVLTISNIIDRCKIIKNDICNKLSKNSPDFSKITGKQLADCGPLKKTDIGNHLLSLVKVCDSINISVVQLCPSPDNSDTVDAADIKQTITDHMRELNK